MQNSIIIKNLPFDASELKIGIVIAQFNHDITEAMLVSIYDNIHNYKLKTQNLTVLQVSGAMEIPLVLQKMAQSKKFAVLVAIGCVIRGDTTHYDIVCKYALDGCLRVNLDYNIPIGNAILTLENHTQAVARTNNGYSALEAALQCYKQCQKIF